MNLTTIRETKTENGKTFREWVESHDPLMKWNFDSPDKLVDQLVSVISESGHVDIKTIFHCMWQMNESGLEFEQNKRFLSEKY